MEWHFEVVKSELWSWEGIKITVGKLKQPKAEAEMIKI